MYFFLIDPLPSDYFDELNIVESVASYFFVVEKYQFSLNICILTVARFHVLQEKNLIFCGTSTVVFLVNISGGVFLLRVLSSAKFLPAVQTIYKFGNFIKIK